MLYDKDIREPLFEFLEEQYGRVRIIEEKNMGKSRADVVMVKPDCLCGLEIKSDADTYARLSRQVADYDQYYDYNYVVVGTSHAMHIEEHVPEYWGIITVEVVEEVPAENEVQVGNNTIDFYLLREAKLNPNMDWKKKICILWRPELVHIQEQNFMPKYKEKSKQFVRDKILEMVDEEKLKVQVSAELFERDYTLIQDTIAEFKSMNSKPKLAKKTKVVKRKKTRKRRRKV